VIRYFVAAVLAALVLAPPVEAKRVIAAYTPIQKLFRADVAVVGKVTAIEKETVNALPHPGATEKQTYQVAVIKVETALVGAANVTHVKVAFIPPPRGEPPAVGPGRPAPVQDFRPVHLTEGQTGLFYLTKHHTGEFYVITPRLRPVVSTDEGYKAQAEQAKRASAALADPVKALKADKAADRAFAAAVLVHKYRSVPEGTDGSGVETVKVSAEESRLVLAALAEGTWKPDPADAHALSGYEAFGQLWLTEKDGWKPPAVKPGEDAVETRREAFAKWLAGPGKGYQIDRFVRKPGTQK
jgi:hypothetical protein